MGEPILRLPILLQLDMPIQHLTDSLISRDSPSVSDYSQGVERTSRKANIGLLTIRRHPPVNDG